MKTLAAIASLLLLSTQAFAATQIHVIEHAVTDATAKVGTQADNRGDILTFTNELFDSANKKKVGGDNGFCIRTETGKAYACEWTNTLPGGQITVQGPFLDVGDTTLAITGGTGKYSGARGEMLLHARDAKGSEYDFKFTLK